jgi:O-antigen/teichoic acid export membrane protein
VIATLIAGPLLLGLFGQSFKAGYTVMLILGVGLVIRSLAGQAGEFMVVAGMQKETLLVSGGVLVVNAVFAAALIPILGIEGAALATAFTMAARSAALIVIVQRRKGLRTIAFTLTSRS